VIAELELPSEDAAFDRPTWLGAEITEEERFYNVRLSQKPFRHWPQNLLASR
jgi:adenylate cyclase